MTSIEEVRRMCMDEASKHPDALAQIVSMVMGKSYTTGHGEITPEMALRELLRLALTKPPQIYDIAEDKMRSADQGDIKIYSTLTAAWGRVVTSARAGATGEFLRDLLEKEAEELKAVAKSNLVRA